MDSIGNFKFIVPEISSDDDLFTDDSSVQFFNELFGETTNTASSSKRVVQRDREKGHEALMEDYFCDNPKYNDATFCQRFRMSKRLFLKIVGDIGERYEWFQEATDARGKKSFTPLQKITSAIKQLATGNPLDEFDEYLCMAQRTSRECLQYFCQCLFHRYGAESLRRPTSHDVALIYQAHEEKHHLPGMLGSIDCTHFVWRNCPTLLRGQYMRGDHQYPTYMLEAIASQDLWIWHAFCSAPGSLNDINVLQQSTLFTTERNGTAPKCPWTLNGHYYKRGYYLVDGIYPKWAIFVKVTPFPTDPNEKKYKKVQESARKDVERAFGVLKAKWGILRRPMRAMSVNKIREVTYACILLHNMILKDDGNAISPVYIRDPHVTNVVDHDALDEMQDEDTHFRLRFDLITHLSTIDLPYLESGEDKE